MMILADSPRDPPSPSALSIDDAELTLGHWLLAHKDTMFRWTMALVGTPGRSDLAARRTFAETAVAVQRLEGEARLVAWLFGEALLAAQRQAVNGVLAESLMAGLAPELRTALRLVARGNLRAEEAWALLPQRMPYVRRRLVHARMAPAAASPALADH